MAAAVWCTQSVGRAHEIREIRDQRQSHIQPQTATDDPLQLRQTAFRRLQDL